MRPVVFDLEGTLVDFQWDIEDGERRAGDALVRLGFPEDAFEGLNYAAILNAAVRRAPEFGRRASTARDVVDAVYDDCDADALRRWSLRDGAEEVVQGVHDRGLVTNVGRAATDALLDRHGLAFDVVVTRDDVDLVKPEPEGLRQAADEVGGDPLFVGDSLTDIWAGEAVGLDVAIVLGGETPESAIRAAAPAFLLASLRELPDVL